MTPLAGIVLAYGVMFAAFNAVVCWMIWDLYYRDPYAAARKRNQPPPKREPWRTTITRLFRCRCSKCRTQARKGTP